MASLQDQGVPIRSSLPTGNYSSDNAPKGTYGTRAAPKVRSTPGPVSGRQSRGSTRNRTPYQTASTNMPSISHQSSSGVGLLEAEFFGALILLVILMFTNSSSYAEQVMSLMKRGTLVCLLFFILALVAGIGDGMAKVAKGFGALIIVGILVTTPASGAITDVDNLIKNDWVGTTEHGEDVGSADTGTGSGGSSGTLGLAEGALNRIKDILGLGII